MDARALFDKEHAIVLDDRFDYEAPRFMAFGLLRGEVVAVVFVDRSNDAIRFISV
ncbi:MAG: BrnT family toxin [Caldilineaceae bacterium]|nr:BrnT family toxin [Caldilineaceae bacterium]